MSNTPTTKKKVTEINLAEEKKSDYKFVPTPKIKRKRLTYVYSLLYFG